MKKEYKIFWLDQYENSINLLPERSYLESMGCSMTLVDSTDVIDNIIFSNLKQYDCIISGLIVRGSRYGSTVIKQGLKFLEEVKEKYPDFKNSIILYTCWDIEDAMKYCEKLSIPYILKHTLHGKDFAEYVISKIEGRDYVSSKDQFISDIEQLITKCED